MIIMAKKFIKPTPEQEIEQLRKDIVRELEHWQALREYGCQDPFWPDGTNMNLTRQHVIYAKERLKELIPDGSLPEEYYLPTPPVVDNDYLAPKGEYFKQRLKRLNETRERVTTAKQPDVDMRIGDLF